MTTNLMTSTLMSGNIRVGTILISDPLLLSQLLQVKCEPYSGSWSRVTALNGSSLDKKIRAAGWNCFFLAAETKATYFGALNTGSVLHAMQRIIRKVRNKNFNCIEITGMTARRILGVSYITISARSRHIQKSNLSQTDPMRQAAVNDAVWARR